MPRHALGTPSRARSRVRKAASQRTTSARWSRCAGKPRSLDWSARATRPPGCGPSHTPPGRLAGWIRRRPTALERPGLGRSVSKHFGDPRLCRDVSPRRLRVQAHAAPRPWSPTHLPQPPGSLALGSGAPAWRSGVRPWSPAGRARRARLRAATAGPFSQRRAAVQRWGSGPDEAPPRSCQVPHRLPAWRQGGSARGTGTRLAALGSWALIFVHTPHGALLRA